MYEHFESSRTFALLSEGTAAQTEIRKLLHCGKASGVDAAGYGIGLAFANFDSGELLEVFFVAGVIRTSATR
jgi:hypothetical protein